MTNGGGRNCALPESIYEKCYDVLHEFSAVVLVSVETALILQNSSGQRRGRLRAATFSRAV